MQTRYLALLTPVSMLTHFYEQIFFDNFEVDRQDLSKGTVFNKPFALLIILLQLVQRAMASRLSFME